MRIILLRFQRFNARHGPDNQNLGFGINNRRKTSDHFISFSDNGSNNFINDNNKINQPRQRLSSEKCILAAVVLPQAGRQCRLFHLCSDLNREYCFFAEA